jgi:predicted ATPase
MFLDDVHWLDEASAALLHYAARSLPDDRVRFLCAARPGELEDNAAMQKVVRALARDQRLVRMELHPLSLTQVKQLASAVDESLDASILFEGSGGNPLFALELARSVSGGGQPRSETLESLLAERLERLDGRARNLVPWAAALGRSFKPELLSLVSGVTPLELFEAVEELERKGILRSAGERYDFSHDLVRDAAYRSLSEPRRRLLHLQISRTLEPLPDPDGALASDIAHHASLAGDAELAARASITAGSRACRLAAYAEAVEIAERALRLIERLPAVQRLPLGLALMRVVYEANPPVAQWRSMQVRARAYLQDAEKEKMTPEVALAHALLSSIRFALGDMDGTQEHSLLAAEAAKDGDQRVAAALAEAASCLTVIERDLPRAAALAEQTIRLCKPRSAEEMYARNALGLLAQSRGAVEEAAKQLDLALTIAGELNEHWREAEFSADLAVLRYETGDYAGAIALCDQGEARAAKLGEGAIIPLCRAIRFLARRATGDRAEKEMPQALADMQRLTLQAGGAWKESASAAQLSGVLIDIQRVDAKAALAKVACFAAEQVLTEEPALAYTLATEAASNAQVTGRRSLIVYGHAIAARAALNLGDRANAERHADTARGQLDASHPMARAREALAAAERALYSGADSQTTPLST